MNETGVSSLNNRVVWSSSRLLAPALYVAPVDCLARNVASRSLILKSLLGDEPAKADIDRPSEVVIRHRVGGPEPTSTSPMNQPKEGMVRDRLAEMQAKSAEIGESKQKNKESDGTPLLNSEEQLEECLKRVTEIDNKIKTMKDEIEQMKKLQNNISNSLINKKEGKKLEQTSDKVFNTWSKLQKEITEYRSEFAGMHMDNTHERMIRAHLDRFGSDVTKTMDDFKAAQLEYIEKTQKLRTRRYEIVTGKEAGGSATVDPSNIQGVCAGDYFEEAQKAKTKLPEIEARDMEIKKIENSVVQVNQLFKEMNASVMEQGEWEDNIERHVERAPIYVVESRNVQLTQARQSPSKARRKRICCIGVLVAILLIAGVIITIVIVSQSDSK
ncbi:uncharacterized protein LOC128558241 [Mercenaria mercenaria]|uniref:uncharacterized protein LOC128558241 n=1 Tax=Mercenaria mercenaria TaxID=6596 RepID=UPI00234F8781|nr:uncharacterized protein LOC128558241 [Mercenaria mercenaria]